MQFIKLHDHSDNSLIILPVDNISSIDKDCKTTIVRTKSGNLDYDVKESVEKIWEMLNTKTD